jgi:transcriptional regulator with XRE-family HTH domain
MRIQELRLQRGWSQEQLAEAAGLSARTVQRMEGGRPGSLDTLKAIAAAFDVDVASLDGPEPAPERGLLRSAGFAWAALILVLLSVLALLVPPAAKFLAATGTLTAAVSMLVGRHRFVAAPALILGVLMLTFELYTQTGGRISGRITAATAQMQREGLSANRRETSPQRP